MTAVADVCKLILFISTKEAAVRLAVCYSALCAT
jgi:hypothetical protein